MKHVVRPIVEQQNARIVLGKSRHLQDKDRDHKKWVKNMITQETGTAFNRKRREVAKTRTPYSVATDERGGVERGGQETHGRVRQFGQLERQTEQQRRHEQQHVGHQEHRLPGAER